MEQRYLSSQDIVSKSAEYLFEKIVTCIDDDGHCSLALSGGRSPVLLLRQLAKRLLTLKKGVLEIFQVDERFVPETSEASNSQMLRSSFIDLLRQSEMEVVYRPMNTSLAIEDCVADYNIALKTFLKRQRILDIVVLGMGTDGHTASIFPEVMEYFLRNKEFVISHEEKFLSHRRITMGFEMLLKSRSLILYVPDVMKSSLLDCVVLRKNSMKYPVSWILHAHADATVLRESST